MDTSDSADLTPEQLEAGLINGTISELKLEKLIKDNVDENENADALALFFQEYIPGSQTMDDFIEKLRQFNSAQICGLVWSANVIAYRCKTCSISPCMSICAQCFQNGNHDGHNYNMFKSQAGGACDCGDSSVMHEFGFCQYHGENRPKTSTVPYELICCAEFLVPHLLKAFIRALRSSAPSGDIVTEVKLVEILNQLSSAGSAIQLCMTRVLTDANLYEQFITDPTMQRLYHYEYLNSEYVALSETYFVDSLMSDSASSSLIRFDTSLRTMLDEIMMWCISASLPEELVRFLLSLLPDFKFKLAFTETFLRLYGVIAHSLVRESLSDGSEVPSRVVHISVQLFSSNVIVEYAMEKCKIIEVILSCIWHMFVQTIEDDRNDDDIDDEDEQILKVHPLALTNDANTGMVVDVDHRLITRNVYWPLLSDFVNILSQEKVIFAILENKRFFNFWLRFLTLFQGMNVNQRILTLHVEYEPNTYMYAFTIELEISAAAMWCFINHLKPDYPSENLICVIKQIIESIDLWMRSLSFDLEHMDTWKLSFHLPLHRYLSVFAYNAIHQFNIDPSLFLPVNDENALLNLMYFPLRTISGYHEILSNIWIRNGHQIMVQAKTYAKSAFSSSMHDADLFFVQLLSCYIEPNVFVENLLKRFHVHSWLFRSELTADLDSTQHVAMLECVLITLCALVGFQSNIVVREPVRIRREVIATLSAADRLYSEVEENVPDPSPLSASRIQLESILEQVSDFKTPSIELLGHLKQGKYTIKGDLFKTEYDPLYVIIRYSKRAQFQSSLERYANYIKREGLFKSDYPIWPPFRLPIYDHPQMSNVTRILRSGVLHNFLLLCLNAFLNDKTFTEHILYFVIYLLELSILNGEDISPMNVDDDSTEIAPFKTNNIFINMCTRVPLPSSSIKPESETESIITLLLKVLQKQRPSDFLDVVNNMCLEQQSTSADETSRIGDCFYFISNIFSISYRLNEKCRATIKQEIENFKTQHQQQQQQNNPKSSDLTAEQKRQKAKNRQLKLLAEIAESQKRFISQQNSDESSISLTAASSMTSDPSAMEQTMATASASNVHSRTGEIVDYECCVCRITKSDSHSPIGLIGTSDLSLLPGLEYATLDENEQRTFSYHSNKIILEEYLKITKQCLTQITGHPYIANYCQNDHHLRSLLIQSCGHSIHVDCLSSYLKAIHPNQDATLVSVNSLLPSNTNFRCPLCLQIANALIPLFDFNDYANENQNEQNRSPIDSLHYSMMNPSRTKLKRDTDNRCLLAFLSGLAAKCVSNESPSSNISINLTNHQSMKQRAAEFDCGTLRAQLVHEQLFYDSASKVDQKNIRKSFYKTVHELHHLGYPFHHQRLWEELTGLQCPPTTTDVFDARQQLAPILLRDPITMLLQILMSAPIHLTSDEFDTVVQIIFNVEFFKSLISIMMEQSTEIESLPDLSAYIDITKRVLNELNLDSLRIQRTRTTDSTIDKQLLENCLEFLKTSSLIKHRLYLKEMPWTTGEHPSPIALVKFLNLNLNSNGIVMPQWYCSEPKALFCDWLRDLQCSGQHYPNATKVLCLAPPRFSPPVFIDLPVKYDDLFHMHNEFHCEYCEEISTNTVLCLICGEVHMRRWLKICCQQQQQRSTEHLSKCGFPAAVMLDIQTTLIVFCLKNTYGFWHSLYLDQHGEEDPKLKRGKTLFLNTHRYDILRTLWLTATYDYQIKNWLPYNGLISHLDEWL